MSVVDTDVSTSSTAATLVLTIHPAIIEVEQFSLIVLKDNATFLILQPTFTEISYNQRHCESVYDYIKILYTQRLLCETHKPRTPGWILIPKVAVGNNSFYLFHIQTDIFYCLYCQFRCHRGTISLFEVLTDA